MIATFTEKKVITLLMTHKHQAIEFILDAYKSKSIDMIEAMRLNSVVKKYFNLI